MHPVRCPCTSRSAPLRPCRPCLPLRAYLACCTRRWPWLQRYSAILSEGGSNPRPDKSAGTSLDGHAYVLQRLSRSVQRLGVPERLLKVSARSYSKATYHISCRSARNVHQDALALSLSPEAYTWPICNHRQRRRLRGDAC